MKYIILAFSLSLSAFAQIPATTEKFPTEESGRPLPGTVPSQENSDFEKAVEDAGPIPDDRSTLDKVKAKSQEILDEGSRGVEIVKANIIDSKILREQSRGTVMVGYQALSTWIPSKKTISYTHIQSKRWSAEFEYSWGDVSFPFLGNALGEISEKRYSLHARHYPGNSFHFIYGVFRNEFKSHLGSDLIERFGGVSKTDVLQVDNMGVKLGMGNRWQFQNGFTVGVDWLRMNVPLFGKRVENETLKKIASEKDTDRIKNIMEKLSDIPTFVVLGLNVGYTF